MSFVSKKTLTKKLLNSKKFRDAFVWEHLKRSLPFQARTMRDERGWTQEKAGEVLGKPQSVISRYESPDYGRVNVQTLLEIASGYDVGLLIKFVPFSRLVREYEDVSAKALSAKSVDDPDERNTLLEWPNTFTQYVKAEPPMLVSGTGKTVAFLGIVKSRQSLGTSVLTNGTNPGVPKFNYPDRKESVLSMPTGGTKTHSIAAIAA